MVPVTSFSVTSTQCSGPTYLPVANPALQEAYGELSALTGTAPGAGPFPPTFSSCTPLPSAAARGRQRVGLLGRFAEWLGHRLGPGARQPTGRGISEREHRAERLHHAQLPPSVTFSVPYTPSGYTQSGTEDPFTLVSFTGATGLTGCVDGSDGIWSNPPGQYDLESPLGPGAGAASVEVFCPDGSELAPAAVQIGVNVLANAYSDNGQPAAASANIALHGVTATINS